jgi:hypothetical protein
MSVHVVGRGSRNESRFRGLLRKRSPQIALVDWLAALLTHSTVGLADCSTSHSFLFQELFISVPAVRNHIGYAFRNLAFLTKLKGREARMQAKIDLPNFAIRRRSHKTRRDTRTRS